MQAEDSVHEALKRCERQTTQAEETQINPKGKHIGILFQHPSSWYAKRWPPYGKNLLYSSCRS